MPVYTKHPDYNIYKEKWDLVRAIVANDAKNYIRTVDINDSVRSSVYREDAILTNFTRLTLNGLVGLVANKPSVIVVPKKLDYLRYDATGEGLGLERLATKILLEVLQTGRCGLLADYPKANPYLSIVDRNDAAFSARIKPYFAENILNVKCMQIGSKYIPYVIVLAEYVDSTNDIFSWKQSCQLRVLYLDNNSIYTQAVYTEKGDLIEDEIKPRDANGNYFNEIPFQFVGSENNDSTYDPIPLYDTAILNLGHYRNSADYEESVFLCGQPMAVVNIGDTDEEQFKVANQGAVKFGSRRMLVLANGGSATLLQAQPNQLADAAMKRKEEQAIAIGARFIMPAGGRETAEAAKIRYSSQNSALGIVVTNTSDALENVLKYVARFENVNSNKIKFRLNTQFYDESADPNLIAQQMLLLDKGVIGKQELRDYGRKTGFIQRSDNELDNDETIAEQESSNNQANLLTSPEDNDE